MSHFLRECQLNSTVEQAFQWHASPSAFERLRPPWAKMTILEKRPGITNGSGIRFKIHMGLHSITWDAIHEGYNPPEEFRDRQQRGPFKQWLHRHRFQKNGEEHCTLIDDIEYRLPLHPISSCLMGRKIQNDLNMTFDFRYRRTAEDLKRHQAFPDVQTMKVAITGASGAVGTHLTEFLQSGGHEVYKLVRRVAQDEHEIHWDPAKGTIEAHKLEGMDAVVHLAGRNIASGRWNEAMKKDFYDSRILGTRLIAETLAKLDHPPKVLISASASGCYGSQADTILTEDTEPIAGFLPELCRDWEAAAAPAREAGIRVVHPRISVVLEPQSGMLGTILLPTKLGGGGVMGSGKQYLPWITMDDLIYGIHFMICRDDLSGPFNLCSPQDVTNYQFTKTLGRVLKRPTLAWVPTPMAKLLFGEMAEALLLASLRCQPKRLEEAGFQFAYPGLEDALRHLLGRTKHASANH